MSVYNAKSTEQDDTYLFTKFDDDLNIVDDSVYLTSIAECTCPAGARSTCRHRQMLPMFLATGRIDTDYFYCFETSSWSRPFAPLDDSEVVTQADIDASQQAPDNPPTDQDWDQLTMKLVNPTETPVCERCGAKVHDACTTDEQQDTCQLPDFCFPDGCKAAATAGPDEASAVRELDDSENIIRTYDPTTPIVDPHVRVSSATPKPLRRL